MSTVEEIEAAIDKLPRQEFFQLITWAKTRFEDEWERQFKQDVKEGRLENTEGRTGACQRSIRSPSSFF